MATDGDVDPEAMETKAVTLGENGRARIVPGKILAIQIGSTGNRMAAAMESMPFGGLPPDPRDRKRARKVTNSHREDRQGHRVTGERHAEIEGS